MRDVNVFTMALSVSIALGVLCILIFSFIRRHFHSIYATRASLYKGEKSPPALSSSFLSWLPNAFSLPDSYIEEQVGADSYFYIRFLRSAFRIFLFCSILGVGLIVPINASDDDDRNELDVLTIDNVQSESSRLWAHVFGCYIFSFFVYREFYHLYQDYVHVRHRWLRKRAPAQYSVLLLRVPSALTTPDELRVHFDHVTGAQVHSAYCVKMAGVLEDAIVEREQVVRQLEQAVAHLQIKGERPRHRDMSRSAMCCLPDWCTPSWDMDCLAVVFGPLVDSINFYQKKLEDCNEQVSELKRMRYETSSTAFVCFKSLYAAKQAFQYAENAGMKPIAAPEPHDVDWPYLVHERIRNPCLGVIKYILLNVPLVLLIVAWSVIGVTAASMIQIKTLSQYLPFLEPLAHSKSQWLTFFEGVLPSLILAIGALYLPALIRVVCRLRGYPSSIELEEVVFNRLAFFQFYNGFFMLTIAHAVLEQFSTVATHPAGIPFLLGIATTKVSHFFVNLLALYAFASTWVEPIRVSVLLTVLWKKRFSAATARECREAEGPQDPDLSYLYSIAFLVFLVTLSCAIAHPLILCFATCFFGAAYLVYRHQFTYVYVPFADGGAHHWPKMFSYCMLALIVAQLSYVGLFVVKLGYFQIVLALPLPFVSIFFMLHCTKNFWWPARNLPDSIMGHTDTLRKQQGEDYSFLDNAYVQPCFNVPDVVTVLPDNVRRNSKSSPVVSPQSAPSRRMEDSDPLLEEKYV